MATTLTACTIAPQAPVQPVPVPEAKPEVEYSVVREHGGSEQRITIAAVGDIMLGTDYPENHLPDDDGVGFLSAVTSQLAAADITFGNLEGVLVDGGEPGKKCSNPSACYRFRSPTRYVSHYKTAGFDVLSLANNHARDFGEHGRSATMLTLDRAGIYHSGRVGSFASFESNGRKIAVLAYAVTRNSNMLLDYRYAEQNVRRYAESHDIVIVSFHGGAEGPDVTHLPFDEEEYFDEPRGDVVRFARDVVDAGADLVIGHGPHVVRAMERYEDRLIAYSLGNFATYYGISVAGLKGVAPILLITLDGEGQFVDGEIVSTIQRRPAGPSIDPSNRALKLLRRLSVQDFGEPGLTFGDDGRLLPADRPRIVRRQFDPESSGDGGSIPCTEAWFWEVETVLGTSDGMGHGPDPGSTEWMSVVEFKLGLRDKPSAPVSGSPSWCAHIDEQLDERLRVRF